MSLLRNLCELTQYLIDISEKNAENAQRRVNVEENGDDRDHHTAVLGLLVVSMS